MVDDISSKERLSHERKHAKVLLRDPEVIGGWPTVSFGYIYGLKFYVLYQDRGWVEKEVGKAPATNILM